MERFGLALRRFWQAGFMVSLLALTVVPAWAQQGGGGEVGGGGSATTTTTETTSTSGWTSDWRIWALIGVVVLVVLIIALTRGRGGSSTTVVK